MSNKNNENTNRITISVIISILSFILSLSSFGYIIYQDNAESLSLWCMEAQCKTDYPITDYFEITGTYVITNNSKRTISIVDAYISHKGKRIDSNLDVNDIFPINIDANSSYKLVVEPIKYHLYVDAYDLELHVISSTQKEYSVKSIYNYPY